MNVHRHILKYTYKIVHHCLFYLSDILDKLRVLEEWSLSSAKRAGCLLVGYEAFRTLVFYHKYKNRGNLSSTKLETIRDKVNKYLLQPGNLN